MKEILDCIKIERPSKLHLWVKAGAKQNSVDGWITKDDKEYLKLSINAIPESGKANKAIITFLAKGLGMPKSSIVIASGKNAPFKVVKLIYKEEF